MRLVAATRTGVAQLREVGGRWSVQLAKLEGAQCVAVDQARSGVVFAGTQGLGLWRSDDAGATWSDTGFPQADVFSVAVSAADGAVYAGCEPSMLFRSVDGGESWNELESLQEIPSRPGWSFPPRPWTSHVRWIAPSPHDASRLLVGIELGGLMVSEDRGETWHDHRPGAQPDVHSLAWHPTSPGRAYEAGGGGAAWSRDGGISWEPADAGRDRHYTWSVAVDPEDPDCWYVSASTGPYSAHRVGRAEALVYRWRGDGPWEGLGGGLTVPLDAMPYALLAGGGRLFAGLADGRVYETRDGGESWALLELDGDPLPMIVALAEI